MKENLLPVPTMFLNKDQFDALISLASQGKDDAFHKLPKETIDELQTLGAIDEQGLSDLVKTILSSIGTWYQIVETTVTTSDRFTRTTCYNDVKQSTIITTEGGDEYRLICLDRPEMIMHFADALRLLSYPFTEAEEVHLPAEFIAAALTGDREMLGSILKGLSEEERFAKALTEDDWSVHAATKIGRGEDASERADLFVGFKIGGQFFLLDPVETENGLLAFPLPPTFAWIELSSWFQLPDNR